MDFPLASHPHALRAAEAAVCAHEAGRFWEMHLLLFEKQQEIEPSRFSGWAEEVGIDAEEFRSCLDEGRRQRVNDDLNAARKAGVNATPSFLLGWIRTDGRIDVVQQIRGAQPYPIFESTLDRLLAVGPSGADAEPDTSSSDG